MKFMDGFKWPIPEAFAESIRSRRFQAGDIFYNNPEAYGKQWDEALLHITEIMQVVNSDAFTITFKVMVVSKGAITSESFVRLNKEDFMQKIRLG